jgi:hypothetical protein
MSDQYESTSAFASPNGKEEEDEYTESDIGAMRTMSISAAPRRSLASGNTASKMSHVEVLCGPNGAGDGPSAAMVTAFGAYTIPHRFTHVVHRDFTLSLNAKSGAHPLTDYGSFLQSTVASFQGQKEQGALGGNLDNVEMFTILVSASNVKSKSPIGLTVGVRDEDGNVQLEAADSFLGRDKNGDSKVFQYSVILYPGTTFPQKRLLSPPNHPTDYLTDNPDITPETVGEDINRVNKSVGGVKQDMGMMDLDHPIMKIIIDDQEEFDLIQGQTLLLDRDEGEGYAPWPLVEQLVNGLKNGLGDAKTATSFSNIVVTGTPIGGSDSDWSADVSFSIYYGFADSQ